MTSLRSVYGVKCVFWAEKDITWGRGRQYFVQVFIAAFCLVGNLATENGERD
jgi:hypothetical protein